MHLIGTLAKYHGLRAYGGEEIELYDHLVEVSRWLAALADGYLYRDGPGPAPIVEIVYRCVIPGPHYNELRTDRWESWWHNKPTPEGWVVHSGPHGRHPRRGDPTIHNGAFELSPGLGKSIMCSCVGPWWYLLTRAHEMQAMMATHTKEFAAGALARRFTTYARDFGPIIGMALTRDNPGAKHIEFVDKDRPSEHPVARFFGVGEAITGQRVVGWRNLDDIVASWERVNEENYLANQYKWYLNPWNQRWKNMPGEPPSPLSIVMSRWHQDDIMGMVVYDREHWQQANPDWAVLHFDPLIDVDGEEKSVCEPMFATERYLKWRDDDPQGFAAQAMNSPLPAGEGNFPAPHEWPRWRAHPVEENILIPLAGPWAGQHIHVDVRFATIDLAGKADADDWTALCVWDYNRDRRLLFLRHAVRAKKNTTDHMLFLHDETRAWHRPGRGGLAIDCCALEEISFGINLLQSQDRDGIDYLGFPLVPPLRPTSAQGLSAKDARIRNYATAAKRMFICIPEAAPWLQTWMNEHSFWPQGSNDDFLDNGADAVYQREVYPGETPEPEEERFGELFPTHSTEKAIQQWHDEAAGELEEAWEPDAMFAEW